MFRSVDPADHVQLRTAFHFLKAGRLFYSSSDFSEEAFANMYFGLEGILQMSHRTEFGSVKYNHAAATKVLDRDFPGWMLPEEFKDFYEHRISIVHPEPRVEADWTRIGFADEFGHRYNWMKALLVYAYCGIETVRSHGLISA